jgi:thiamine pyrophosphate-dependent acetolactate synthase large subunit-like protein
MLKRGLFTPKPVLMEFQVAREECVYPMVRPGGSICDMTLGTREMIN